MKKLFQLVFLLFSIFVLFPCLFLVEGIAPRMSSRTGEAAPLLASETQERLKSRGYIG